MKLHAHRKQLGVSYSRVSEATSRHVEVELFGELKTPLGGTEILRLPTNSL